REDQGPVDSDCSCYTCRTHTRAYLRHLFQSKEILALQLSTIHNLAFYHGLMSRARQAIVERRFAEWSRETLARLKPRSGVDVHSLS
ncbi:MAG TPA: tRNA-guanine transglycosylase, partial [Bacteroidota bacterium]